MGKNYLINLKLESGANLEQLMFSHSEHRWIFTYDYRTYKKEKSILLSGTQESNLEASVENIRSTSDPTLINTTKLCVNYDDGNAGKIELTMDLVRPPLRGKVKWLGVDISPGSHMFIEFKYHKRENEYVLAEAIIGVGKRVNFDTESDSVQFSEFPFPIATRIKSDFGMYKIPFLNMDDKLAYFEFPSSIVSYK